MAAGLRFGVITAYADEDPGSSRILRACGRHGEAVALDPSEGSLRVASAGLEVRFGGEDARAFDALLLVRGLSPLGDADVQFELYRALAETGRLLMSPLPALLAAQDKLRTSQRLSRAGVPTPDAAAVQGAAEADRALAWLGRAVVKPLDGSLGDGVERIDDGPAGRRRARELLARRGSLYLQRFVPHGGRDVRAFVVGARVEGAVLRRAPAGDFRTNEALGAAAKSVTLSESARRAAIEAAVALGLDWAGVDLVEGPSGPLVLEVNGNPGWDAIERATGRDMAVPIAARARARVVAQQRALGRRTREVTGWRRGSRRRPAAARRRAAR